MVKEPLVSVIVPCYNHSKYVQESIGSIIGQGYNNIELIVIDDGSRDGSVQKIEEMALLCKARFVRFEFRYRANKGLCETLNEALLWCRGDYVVSIASDDLMLPGRVAEQVGLLNGYGDQCVGVFGGAQLIDQHGAVVGELRVKSRVYCFKDIYLHRHNLPACTQMLRASAVRECGGYPAGHAIEDWYMWLSLTAKGGYLVSQQRHYACYRTHVGNTSSNVGLMHSERLKIVSLFHGYASGYVGRLAKACCYLATSLQCKGRIEKVGFIVKSVIISPLVVFERKFYIAIARMVS